VLEVSAVAGGGPFRGTALFKVMLSVADDDEVSERVFSAIASAGLTLRTLQPVSAASLEDVFTHLTTRDAALDEDDADGDGDEDGEQDEGEGAAASGSAAASADDEDDASGDADGAAGDAEGDE
jgi:hypothetical protein